MNPKIEFSGAYKWDNKLRSGEARQIHKQYRCEKGIQQGKLEYLRRLEVQDICKCRYSPERRVESVGERARESTAIVVCQDKLEIKIS